MNEFEVVGVPLTNIKVGVQGILRSSKTYR